jgi:hypothetical protein
MCREMLMLCIVQTVGDAISDLLLVETILRYRDWDIKTWNSAYIDLPSRQIKVKVRFSSSGSRGKDIRNDEETFMTFVPII